MSAIDTSRLFALVVGVALSSCCKRELMSRHPSPSDAQMLTIVRVECAGFDSFHIEVRLGHDASSTELVASIGSAPVVQVTWVDDHLVQIFVPEQYSRDVKKPEYDGVHIEFR